MRKFTENKNFMVGFLLISFLLAVCVVSFFYTPYPVTLMHAEYKHMPPSAMFLLGTDNFGRDILSRLMVGSRTAFFVGFFSVFIAMAAGTALGAMAGYFGGIADVVITRIVDLVMTFPTVLLALMLITVFGSGRGNMIMVLGIAAMPRFARLARGSFMQAKNMEYVKSARMKGAGNLRIIFIHILPNIISPIIVNASFSFSMSVMTEAALSYLGLGIQPPHPSWGRMLNEAQPYLQQAPWYVFFTGIALVIMVLGFNLFGDGLNEIYSKK